MFLKITKRQWNLIILLVILLLAFYFILPISLPLIIAFLTALVLNPVVRLLQRRIKFSRRNSVLIIFLLFLLLSGVLGTFIVTKTVTQVVDFVEAVPTYINQLNNIYEDWEENLKQYTKDLPPEFFEEISNSLEGYITEISNTVKEKITIENISKVFAVIPQYLISIIVYLIALFLFMLELPKLTAKMYNLLTKETAEKVTFMTNRVKNVIVGFFKAQFLVSILIFIVTLLGLLLIVPEIALVMSIIIWLIDLIPIIGSIIILGPWALFMLLAGDVTMAIKLAMLAIILLAIRRTVEPKVMGKHIGLSPLATLIAMFLGLQLLGILGFILGPLAVIVFNSAREAGIIKWDMKI
ncbi:sporulation integral membrane protein YtvI [Ornithinibacillus sp. L9]|uniref:Sporulation integral membrane protein YtvI n=1 Tax=Ornithinibacillus caprae TaxID=2678566 RepID=A0A6N8FNC7_9BACI|nr:sporulation integral membrane protein YtvI [Ornithinibacillus caprae]MUK89557.1 sporulation integral membrane protein YtvI [Ornithinibacillus caprae]